MPHTLLGSIRTSAKADPGTTVVRDLAPPAWARELCASNPEKFTLVTVRIDDVPDLPPAEVERRTFEAYARIVRTLADSPARHPVRFWNHVPFITEPADAGRDNYMVFNTGRFRAFEELLGGTARFERDVATASAIGHWGRELVVHCLAADAPGAAVNNPRQVAPYHYSQRFGPLPPCFARATRLTRADGGGASDVLLVGGTASVRGEDSVHGDDLASQCRETFVNLAVLLGAAAGRRLTPSVKIDRWLAAFRELRVYYPNRAHAAEIELTIRDRFRSVRRLEMVHADLCRAELLVEIEGLAELGEIEK